MRWCRLRMTGRRESDMLIGAINHPARDLLAEVRWIGENGFDYVDLALEAPAATPDRIDLAALRSRITDLGLEIIVHAAELPVSHPYGRLRRAALDELRHDLDLAAELGSALLVTRFQHWPDWMGDEAGVELYGQLYDILCRQGAQAGVTVAMENHHHNAHQLKRLRRIAQRSPDLRLALNVGHANLQVAKNQTREFLFDMGERVIHVYLSDNNGSENGRLPLAAAQSGGVDWQRELANFKSFGYDRTFTLEIGGDRRWLLASRDYLQQLWAAG